MIKSFLKWRRNRCLCRLASEQRQINALSWLFDHGVGNGYDFMIYKELVGHVAYLTEKIRQISERLGDRCGK